MDSALIAPPAPFPDEPNPLRDRSETSASETSAEVVADETIEPAPPRRRRRDRARRSASAALIFSLATVFAIRGDLFGQDAQSTVAAALFADRAEAAVDHADSLVTADSLGTPDSVAFHKPGAALEDVSKLEPLPLETLAREIDQETLWLARVIYSETKRPEEQELVAWVVRNRVETTYRGKVTYRDVVLDRMQFSAFNPGTRTRQRYERLTPHSQEPGWHKALTIAHEVRHADPDYRPFSETTRHFYSEQSMVGRKHPVWAEGKVAVTPERPHQLDERRFRFFENIG